MLDFLKHPYTEDDIQCAVSNAELFHRSHTKTVNPYNPEVEKFVLNEIKKIDGRLQKHNIYVYHTYKNWLITQLKVFITSNNGIIIIYYLFYWLAHRLQKKNSK